jgi:SAM-dependent methyltransferase
MDGHDHGKSLTSRPYEPSDPRHCAERRDGLVEADDSGPVYFGPVTTRTAKELNIGAGATYIPGLVNIDISERADLSLDLSKDPLPFEDNSVQTIVSIATLEHIPDYLFALGEMHRVLSHDGELLLMLPYVTSTEHHLVNPYHLHNFSERFVDLFDPELLKNSAVEENAIAFRSVYEEFLYVRYFGMAPKPVRTWARLHLFNTVRVFDIGVLAIKDADVPVDASPRRAREMKARMEELREARVPYPGVRLPRRSRKASRLRMRLRPYRERRAS